MKFFVEEAYYTASAYQTNLWFGYGALRAGCASYRFSFTGKLKFQVRKLGFFEPLLLSLGDGWLLFGQVIIQNISFFFEWRGTKFCAAPHHWQFYSGFESSCAC